MQENKKAVLLKGAFCTIIVIACILWVIGLISAVKQPTYKSWFDIGEPSAYSFEVNDLDQKIVQQFEAPCDEVFEKVAVRIGTHWGKSRSQWKVELFEGSEEERIYEGTFDAEEVKDNSFFNVIDEEIKVNKDLSYKLVITPVKIQGDLGLAFYADEEGNGGYLSGGDSEEHFDLAVRVYGCADRDLFWAGSYIAVSLFVVLIFIRIWLLRKRKISWTLDPLFQTMVIMLLYFFLHLGGLDAKIFTDENDNIRGGMIIARGGVLYKDYITQHTPFMYYLCAVFAKLGASSLPQFRIVYHMFCAVFAGFIYLRNGKKFGQFKIASFLIMEPFVLYLIHSSDSLRILSDNIQAMALSVLLLEYLGYWKKPGVGIKRSIIVSIAIIVSLGCAFLSAYPITVIGVGVIINEASHIRRKRRRRRPVSYYVKRYRKLVLTCFLPFILCAAYFGVNGALPVFYEMSYRFNVEVYEKYIHMGGSKLAPLYVGIKRFFLTMIQNVAGLFNDFSAYSLICLLLLLAVSFSIGLELWKRNYLKGVTIFLFLCMCYTRDQPSNNFHVTAFWNTALLIAILSLDKIRFGRMKEKWQQVMPAVAIVAIFLIAYEPYGHILGKSMFLKHTVTLCEWEQYVVDHTEEGDTILIDAFSYDSIYLIDQNRCSISRAYYFLPWYMDWYQDEVIQDLQEQKPSLVLYNPDLEVWEVGGFLKPLKKQVDKDYVRDKITGIYIRK